jgi:hypothetical protein
MVDKTIVNGGYSYILVGGAITILKNDGVRQWEG